MEIQRKERLPSISLKNRCKHFNKVILIVSCSIGNSIVKSRINTIVRASLHGIAEKFISWMKDKIGPSERNIWEIVKIKYLSLCRSNSQCPSQHLVVLSCRGGGVRQFYDLTSIRGLVIRVINNFTSSGLTWFFNFTFSCLITAYTKTKHSVVILIFPIFRVQRL